VKRRDFVRAGWMAGMGGVLAGPGRLVAAGGLRPGGASLSPLGSARNVILFAYDGFGFEDLGSARYFAERHLQGRRLALEGLLGRGASGFSATHSLSSVVTDSAAASTAWATGRKAVNGHLSILPDGRPLTTIFDLARAVGRATGMVTNTRLTHATPAAWVARIHDRDLEDEIALQYLDFEADVMLGGGSRHFDPARREDGLDLFQAFADRGYEVLRTPADAETIRGRRLFGAFTPDHLPFEIDRRNGHVASPSLAGLTAAALRALADHGGGFVLQVEAGRVDHANHQNDPAALVWDVVAADDALDVVLDFVDRTPDTALIVVSDHSTGLGGVFGLGPSYRRSDEAFATLALRNASQEYLLRHLGDAPSPAQVREALASFMGIRLREEEAARAAAVIAGELRVAHPIAHGSSQSNSLHVLLTSEGRPGDERVNFAYGTGNHSAGPVPLVLYGAQVEPRPLGMVDNTELFHWMAGALGSDFRNPEPDPETGLSLSVPASVLAGY